MPKSKVADPTPEELLSAVAVTLAEDILMAFRYHYYVKARSLVPDLMYDAAEKEFLSRPTTDAFSTPLNLPGSDNPESYPDRIKCLALYLSINDLQKAKAYLSQRKSAP